MNPNRFWLNSPSNPFVTLACANKNLQKLPETWKQLLISRLKGADELARLFVSKMQEEVHDFPKASSSSTDFFIPSVLQSETIDYNKCSTSTTCSTPENLSQKRNATALVSDGNSATKTKRTKTAVDQQEKLQYTLKKNIM